MRIIVIDIAASKTGALSILLDFYNYIRDNEREHEWIFLVGDAYIEETERIRVHVMSEVKKNWLCRLKFDLLTGKGYVSSLKPDVVFSMQNTLPLGLRGRQVLYLHQPLGYQRMKRFSFFKAREREYAVYQYIIGALIDASVKKAARTIVQTGWMKAAVAEKTGVQEDRIVQVLPDVADISSRREPGKLETNRFFFPSGDIIYKNHECVMKAVKLLMEEGQKDFDVIFTLKDTSEVTDMELAPLKAHITCAGPLPREQVFDHYNRRVLVFPSYIETFGYPLAEARQLGTLILASDCPFCHEILKDYPNVRYFPPFSPEALADLMRQSIAGEIPVAETACEKETKESSWAQIAALVIGQ